MPDSAVLVLGASGALGSRIATLLAAGGTHVIGTASSEAGLSRVPQEVGTRKVADLSNPGQCAQLAVDIAALGTPLSGIVVASGLVGFAAAQDTPPDLASRMMQVNYLGPASVINSLSPSLMQSATGSAFVAGITGVVVERTFPGMSAYTASKVALSSYLQVIGKEWRRYKIAAIDIHLGHTETGLATRPLFGQAPAMPTGLDPDHVASVIVQALGTGEAVVPSSAFD